MASSSFHLCRVLFLFLLASLLRFADSETPVSNFTYNGFSGADLIFDSEAKILPNGLLQLTNHTQLITGHAFHHRPITFKPNSSLSFSTTFVFAMVPESTASGGGHGIAFTISPTTDFTDAVASQHLGLFNSTNMGNSSNHVVAVELDAMRSPEFQDIDDNHVGIDLNTLISDSPATVSWVSDLDGVNRTLRLLSGDRIQIWIQYNDEAKQMNVTVAPFGISKPKHPLISTHLDLSSYLVDSMFVGFSSSTSTVTSEQYILGWSFTTISGEEAPPLDLKSLPVSPRPSKEKKKLEAPVTAALIILSIILAGTGIGTYILRLRRYRELKEDWEREYNPERLSYRDLYRATHGFKEKQVLGSGGFGKVYGGILPSSKIQIAVKRISHDSRQGMKEFVAEIVSIGKLRHRNLVHLLGYCRRKGELLLVYDYMPNGSLDKLLFSDESPAAAVKPPPPVLSWPQRFKILRGVAAGLLYLHEEWDQVVLHRDIKASNVLLDADLNGRLGDFGLARLYDHGTNPQTTHVVGTVGYLAPELSRLGKATTATDVYAFGVFMLEVACGKRPIDGRPGVAAEEVVLVDWVIDRWRSGEICEAADRKMMGGDFAKEEVELVLKLGLLCSHNVAAVRPSMRQVMQFLDGDAELPAVDVEGCGIGAFGMGIGRGGGETSEFVMSFASSTMMGKDYNTTVNSMSSVDSILNGGR
ncbi:L-type lectin-domain containing receptor kinase IV.2 [Linum perenne]